MTGLILVFSFSYSFGLDFLLEGGDNQNLVTILSIKYFFISLEICKGIMLEWEIKKYVIIVAISFGRRLENPFIVFKILAA